MFSIRFKIVVILLNYLILIISKIKCDEYRIGVGIGDITGPAADINMMGYAKTGQDTQGIHFRLYSRAAIIEDSNGNRVCFVSCDVAMISQIVKLEVIKILEQKYNGLYTKNNVMLSSTHTHSGPAGFLQYVLYIITSQGFIEQNFKAIRDGIVRSIIRAHSNMTAGYIYVNSGQLLEANINRSPTAYVNNNAAERARYDFDTDKNMTLLKLTDINGTDLGAITWFAVHATSMNNTNKLISGDNKGYASMLFEQHINGGTLHGKGPFVALFPQSNEGDVSPNTKGPHCLDTGLVCDTATSTCNGKTRRNNGHYSESDSQQALPHNEKCVASGPGKDMFESTQIIGQKQYLKARELYNNAVTRLSGQIKYIHQTINMSNVAVELPNNTTVKTCKPAMGYSFAAGTTDGPGAFDFHQGDTTSSPFWNLVRDFVRRPSHELIRCQHPKPILLPTGEMNFPYGWQPMVLPTQIFQIGSFLIIAVPAEFTTMSGRRLREAVKQEYDRLSPKSVSDVVISGLANAYSSYVATLEEYQVQRYEGASTLYGPYTLDAYIQQYKKLASHLATGQKVEPGPQEPNLLERQISLKPGVIYDGSPFGHKFGDVVQDAQSEYTPGSTVLVTFVSGNPRNDLKTESTFLSVERWNTTIRQWNLIATDANWETKFFWQRTNSFFGESQVTVLWDIPQNIEEGSYRIRHFGNSKNLMQQIRSYIGTSKTFSVKKSTMK